MRHKVYMFGWIIIFLCLSFNMVNSQNLIHANPADLSSPHAFYVNPAVIFFQNNQLMLGMKLFQLGFIDGNSLGLRNSFLGGFYNNLLAEFGMGFTAQYFTTPIYAESQLGIIISRPLFQNISIGVALSLLNHSFNKANFQFVDMNDPVLNNHTSKTAFSVGMGLLFNPLTNLNIGLGVNHLNEPNISFVDKDIRKSRIYDLGLSYKYHFVEPSIGIVMTDNLIIPDFSVRYYPFSSNSIKFGYSKDDLRFEGQLSINANISINCSYDYPTTEIGEVAAGSPKFSFIYTIPSGMRVFDVNVFDNLVIVEKKVKITITDQCREDFWESAPQSLTKLILDIAEGSKAFPFEPVRESFDEMTSKNVGIDFLNSLLVDVKKLPNQPIRLIVPPEKKEALLMIKQAISNTSKFSSYEIEYYTSLKLTNDDQIPRKAFADSIIIYRAMFWPPNLKFYIKTNNKQGKSKWKLIVKDLHKTVIREFDGLGQVPQMLTWNCMEDEEKFVSPGKYSYQFIYDRNKSAKKSFMVKQVKRFIDIKVTKNAIPIQKKIKGIDIVVN